MRSIKALLVLAIIVFVVNTRAERIDADGKRKVCLHDIRPLVACGADMAMEDYSGYSVSLFKKVVDYLEIPQDLYYYVCMNISDVYKDLYDPNGTCYVAATGLEITQEDIDAGVIFSWPMYKQGLRILVHYEPTDDIWFIFSAFSLNVWLIILGTSLIVGCILWIFEEASGRIQEAAERIKKRAREGPKQKGGPGGECEEDQAPKPWSQWLKECVDPGIITSGVKDISWEAAGMFVAVAGVDPVSLGARFITFAYGFLILIMVTLYTASTAAGITASRLNSQVNGLDDLIGQSVITDSWYLDELKQQHVTASARSFDSPADRDEVLAALRNKDVFAVVYDDSWVQWVDSQECTLFAAGNAFNTRSLAFAFANDTNVTIIDMISKAILELQRTEEVLDELEDEFINLPPSCPIDFEPDSPFKIRFQMVAGLWIIVGAAMLAGPVILLGQYLGRLYLFPPSLDSDTDEDTANHSREAEGTGGQGQYGDRGVSLEKSATGMPQAAVAPSKPSAIQPPQAAAQTAAKALPPVLPPAASQNPRAAAEAPVSPSDQKLAPAAPPAAAPPPGPPAAAIPLPRPPGQLPAVGGGKGLPPIGGNALGSLPPIGGSKRPGMKSSLPPLGSGPTSPASPPKPAGDAAAAGDQQPAAPRAASTLPPT